MRLQDRGQCPAARQAQGRLPPARAGGQALNTLEVIIIIAVVVLGLLAFGGSIVIRRRREATRGQFESRVDEANRDLAAAHAADNGWEPARVEAAARRAFAERRPGEAIDELALVQVVDPPGTEDDQAVYRIVAAGGEHHLTLGRQGDEWRLEDLR